MAQYKPIVNLLHISDLHLRKDIDDSMSTQFDKFIEKIEDIETQNNIHLILITGDLFDRGQGKKSVENFLTRLTNTLPDCKIAMCPGNHDLDRNALLECFKKLSGNNQFDYRNLDALLKCDDNIITAFENHPFSNYNELFFGTQQENNNKYKANEPSYRSKLLTWNLRGKSELSSQNDSDSKQSQKKLISSLLGYNDDLIDDLGIRLFSFNSAWKCFGDSLYEKLLAEDNEILSLASEDPSKKSTEWIKNLRVIRSVLDKSAGLRLPNPDRRNLCLGNDMVKQIFTSKRISEVKETKNILNISLMHHPPAWLEWNHVYSSGDRTDIPYRTIAENSQLIFSGHEHALPKAPINYENICQVLTEGTLFNWTTNKRPGIGSFSIIRINKKSGKFEIDRYRTLGSQNEYLQFDLDNSSEYKLNQFNGLGSHNQIYDDYTLDQKIIDLINNVKAKSKIANALDVNEPNITFVTNCSLIKQDLNNAIFSENSEINKLNVIVSQFRSSEQNISNIEDAIHKNYVTLMQKKPKLSKRISINIFYLTENQINKLKNQLD